MGGANTPTLGIKNNQNAMHCQSAKLPPKFILGQPTDRALGNVGAVPSLHSKTDLIIMLRMRVRYRFARSEFEILTGILTIHLISS